VADRSLVVDLPNPERSPGTRTYQASLLGMLLIAIRLAETRTPACSADRLRQEITGLADAIEATARAIRDRCRQVAAQIATAPVVTVVGSGPGYGTALFAAAKIIEASGVYASGQDLEEWSHVGHAVLPVHGTIREEFSPLLYHLFADYTACYLAQHLTIVDHLRPRPSQCPPPLHPSVDRA
jgi:glutamine---fructose-6-phosphate transaminase (isomerizing)